MNVIDLATQHVRLKRVASTNGGEWHGPCPSCGGDDRFHVWPQQNDGTGAYWCRGCGRAGDNIQFLRDFDGLSFREACMRLKIDIPDQPGQPGRNLTSRKRLPLHESRPPFQPKQYDPPPDPWQEKAGKFISWAQSALIKNPEILAWLKDRGIDEDAADTFRLGWNPGEDGKDLYRRRTSWGLEDALNDDGKPKPLWIPRGLVIPYIIDGIIYRIRVRRPEGDPRYYVLPGSSMAMMIIGLERRAYVVVESELDAIAVAACQDLAGAVAVGSSSAKPDAEVVAILQDALSILLALDFDAAGTKALAFWFEHFPRAERWPVPQGKDPGDARRLGTDLNRWIKAGLPPALTLDLSTTNKQRGHDGKDRRDYNVTERSLTISPELSHDRPDLPAELFELRGLLRKNPGTVIINAPFRFTVLRHDRFVGGRINELVFKTPGVRDYIMNHPAERIDADNLIWED